LQKISKIIFFVNGYTKNCKPLRPYWTEKGDQFLDATNQYFGGNCEFEFVNGEGPWFSSASYRTKRGESLANSIILDLKGKLAENAEICLVSHSMGSAFSEGMISCFKSNNLNVKKVIHLSVADAKNIKINEHTQKIECIQVGITGDKTTRFFANPFAYFRHYKIPAVKLYGEILSKVETFHPEVSKIDQKKWDFHYDTKTFAYIWEYIKVLEEINFKSQKMEKELILPSNKFLFKTIFYQNNYYHLEISSITNSELRYKTK
jgi:hypothetical protein